MTYILESPLKIQKFTLGLNPYRNSHYQVLNKSKIAYKQYMYAQIQKLPTFEHISITYILFPKTHRITDLDNICSVHAKFFQDALVEYHKIPDDSYEYIQEVSYLFGYVDKINHRVEIQINPITSKDKNVNEN